MRTQAVHARLLTGFFLLLFAALSLSLPSLGWAGRSGAAASERSSQTPILASGDAGRAILVAERKDLPHAGWMDPTAALAASAVWFPLPDLIRLRVASRDCGPLLCGRPHGFLARAPPRSFV